jgi:catechol 2,3-dioxygenase-like lactoylglutathione lyase family enzyme
MEMNDANAVTTVDQVATVMVPVADQDRAIAFYTEKLGFELRADTPFGNGDRWVEVAPAGAATTVALVTPMEGQEVGVD